jgi:hypothetical protein
MYEVSRWKDFRKALLKSERESFDQMLDNARLFNSASMCAVRTSVFEGMLMAILLHHYGVLQRLDETTGREHDDRS